MNKIIGLVGEDPNDTTSIKNLLSQKFNQNVSFITLIKNKRGYQLDNIQTQKALKIEFDLKKPDIVIFIRDLDGLATEKDKIDVRNKWYQSISKGLKCKKSFLLNIYELEALLLADINTFNKAYNTAIKFTRDVTYVSEPKEFLMQKTKNGRKQYYESHCPELFKQLDFDTVKKNCNYFDSFITEFTKILKTK